MTNSDYVCLRVGDEIKSQAIRVLDVVAIGPLMIGGGIALDRRGHGLAGAALAVLGISTIIYNGVNYIRVRRAMQNPQRYVR